MTQFEVILLQAQINSVVGMLCPEPLSRYDMSRNSYVPKRCCPETVMSRNGYVPKRLCPETVMSRNGHVPKWLGPELARSRSGYVPKWLGPETSGAHSRTKSDSRVTFCP